MTLPEMGCRGHMTHMPPRLNEEDATDTLHRAGQSALSALSCRRALPAFLPEL